jgi:class 3 adenylate cyclase
VGKPQLDRPAVIGAALRDLVAVSAATTEQAANALSTVLRCAVSLCASRVGSIHLYEDGRHRTVAVCGLAEGPETATRPVAVQGVETLLDRVIATRDVVHLPDVPSDLEYVPTGPRLFGEFGSVLGVPLARDDAIRGVLFLGRTEARPFSDEEIALASTVATKVTLVLDEAALHEESRDLLHQQAATGEILRMLTRSASDPGPLFHTIVERARVLCQADNATLAVFHGERSRVAANAGEFVDEVRYNAAWADLPALPDQTTITGRILLTQSTVHLPDIDADKTLRRTVVPATGARSVLAAPLLRDGDVIGTLVVRRRDLRPFATRHVRLLETFADQAAIAIENARLFGTVTTQSRELARFLSPEIVKLVTTDDGARLLDAHRREITVLFCDLRGFSAFSEVTEPEEVLRVLRQYQATMGHLIVEHRGTLEHFAGDGMMVFFNDPVPVDGHERAAITLAVAMQNAFAEMTAAWRQRGHELGLGIGIASGFATLGRIGFEGRYDYGAVGNVVIVASRLSTEAKSGEILLTQRVEAALDERLPAESAGMLKLRGITRPVAAFTIRT